MKLTQLIQEHKDAVSSYQALNEAERYSDFGIQCLQNIKEKAERIREIQNQIKNQNIC